MTDVAHACGPDTATQNRVRPRGTRGPQTLLLDLLATASTLEPVTGQAILVSWTFPQIWPHLSTSSRSWLMKHNGEPLADELIAEILSVTGGEQDPQ